MTESKHLKRRVRERMAKTGERYAAARAQVIAKREPERVEPPPAAVEPVTSDAAVLAAPGRELRDWFALLDEHDAGATRRSRAGCARSRVSRAGGRSP